MAFSAAAPATYDATGYSALTWTPSGEVINVGDIGPENNVITYETVCDGSVHKRLGATNFGSQTLEILFDSDNAAQAILAAAVSSKTAISVRETLPQAENNSDSDIYYYRAYVASAKTMTGSSGDTVRYSVTLEIDGANGGIVLVTATVAV